MLTRCAVLDLYNLHENQENVRKRRRPPAIEPCKYQFTNCMNSIKYRTKFLDHSLAANKETNSAASLVLTQRMPSTTEEHQGARTSQHNTSLKASAHLNNITRELFKVRFQRMPFEAAPLRRSERRQRGNHRRKVRQTSWLDDLCAGFGSLLELGAWH